MYWFSLWCRGFCVGGIPVTFRMVSQAGLPNVAGKDMICTTGSEFRDWQSREFQLQPCVVPGREKSGRRDCRWPGRCCHSSCPRRQAEPWFLEEKVAPSAHTPTNTGCLSGRRHRDRDFNDSSTTPMDFLGLILMECHSTY